MPQFVVIVVIVVIVIYTLRVEGEHSLFLGHAAGGGPTSWRGAAGREYQGACRVESQSPS